MPNYANMPIYQHGLRATDPTTGAEVAGTLDPAKRYNLEFTSQEIPPSQVQPEQLAEAIRTEQRFPVAREDLDVSDRAESDHKTGTLAAQNQYLEDMKIVDQLPPNSQQHQVLSAMAVSKFQAELGKLETHKQKWDNVRRTLRQNPQYDNAMIRDLETDYYDKNPIYEARRADMPRIEAPSVEKPVFTERQVQLALGDLATNVEDIRDMPSAIKRASELLGRDFATNYPEAIKVITDRAKTNFQEPLTPPALAGLEPAAPEKKPTFLQRLFGRGKQQTPYETYYTEAQRLGATTIATPQEFEQIQRRKAAPSAATAPTVRPTWLAAYPDAVWSPQHNEWIVIKGGKIVAIRNR